MPTESTIANYRFVQSIARDVLAYLATAISAGDTERTIALKAASALRDRGILETWYYDCPALVLLGSRSCLSLSGRHYQPAEEPVGSTNLVTVDLSPMHTGCWGDCARSFFVEGGTVTPEPVLPDFSRGKRFLEALHSNMLQFAYPDVTFHQLYEWTHEHIVDQGFRNLDFLGNLGHSIATSKEARHFIEKGNHARLSDVPFFTFEPHVATLGGKWGFKHENIFYFDAAARLREL